MSEIRNIGAYDLWQMAKQMAAIVRDKAVLQKHLTCIDGEWGVIRELVLMKQCWEQHGASNR